MYCAIPFSISKSKVEKKHETNDPFQTIVIMLFYQKFDFFVINPFFFVWTAHWLSNFLWELENYTQFETKLKKFEIWNLHLFVDTLLSDSLKEFFHSVELLKKFCYLCKGIALSFFGYQYPKMNETPENNNHFQTFIFFVFVSKIFCR